MTENKRKTGTAEIVNKNGKRVLRLIQIFPDGSPKNIFDIPVDMPEVRVNRLLGQPRWKDGSLLDIQQRTDEEYTKKNHIA